MSNEKDCIYVSSRGILKSYDVFSNTPISSINNMINYNKELNNNIDGTVIYLCNSALREFIKFLSIINYKFIIVSGDSDTTVPDDIFLNLQEFNSFMDNSNLLHWYSQNCVIEHPKLTQIPIGMDYHTLSERNYIWGQQKSPVDQEKEFTNLKITSRPFWERKIKCYSNFHFHFYKFGQDRKDAIDKIPSDLMFYEEREILRIDTWRHQSEYAFVISPHGNGLDCHRTWEALMLGCIVIVKTSGIDPLYSGLPVLIVNDWSDINKKLLEDTIMKYTTTCFNYNKLTLKYWITKIFKGVK